MTSALRILAASLVAGWGLGVGSCTCGSGPYEGEYFDSEKPAPLANVKFREGEKGPPEIVGCADGQREGLSDPKVYPRIAGCVASWEGKQSLRDKKGTVGCGDDGVACGGPADACAPGWHVCGMQGKTSDLKDRVSAEDCGSAGPGRFNAAISHGQTDELCPPKPTPSTIFPCTQAGIGAEPVCCGSDCLGGQCKDAVWTDKTLISRGTAEGCGALTSSRNGGVLCCYDKDEPPPPMPPAGGAATAAPAAGTAAPAGATSDAAAAGQAGQAPGPTKGTPEAGAGPKAGEGDAGAAKAKGTPASGAEKAGAEKAGAEKAGAEKAGAPKADAAKGDAKKTP